LEPSTFSPSRSAVRLTAMFCASSSSRGRKSPGLMSPLTIFLPICWMT